VPTENDANADQNADLQALTDPAALLAELRTVHVPEASLIPAPGWWLLTALVLIGVCVLWVLWKRYLRNAWRREALVEVNRLTDGVQDASAAQLHTTVRAASTLLRRVMMHVDGRNAVAGLTDESWLQAVHAHKESPPLEESLQTLLTEVPYQNHWDESVSESMVRDLLQWMSVYFQHLAASAKQSAS